MCVSTDTSGHAKRSIHSAFFTTTMVMNDNKYWFYFYVGHMLWCDVNLHHICFDYFMWTKKRFFYSTEKTIACWSDSLFIKLWVSSVRLMFKLFIIEILTLCFHDFAFGSLWCLIKGISIITVVYFINV